MIASTAAMNGFDQARLARIDDWMQRCIDLGRFTGSSALIARDGEIAYLGSAGLASVERNMAYQRDTIVRIYSMTKMVTSVGFMKLFEKGLIHLDTPVSALLPEFTDCQALIPGATRIDQTEPVPPPTLQQLLTHTSGLTYGFNPGVLAEHYDDRELNFAPQSGGLEAACKRVAAAPLAFRPGTNWNYSVGIDVIGRVIEVLDGRPLDVYFKEEILDPLGMVDTGFDLPLHKIDRFADCYSKTEEDNRLCTDRAETSIYLSGQVDTFSGGGGLLSTLDDYFRFGEMIRRGGKVGDDFLLSPRTVAYMRRNHLAGEISSMGPSSFAEMPMDGMGFGIGGGVVLEPARTRMAGSVGDFGWGGMASTYFWTDPIERLTCIYFTQLIPSSSYPNRAELKALVHGALVD